MREHTYSERALAIPGMLLWLRVHAYFLSLTTECVLFLEYGKLGEGGYVAFEVFSKGEPLVLYYWEHERAVLHVWHYSLGGALHSQLTGGGSIATAISA